MLDNRYVVFPRAISLATVPFTIPERGKVLSCSAILPFRLEDGHRIRPEEWQQVVADVCGMQTPPDSFTPLANAEVLILGKLPAVKEDVTDAYLRCGSIEASYSFYPDPDARDEAWEPNAEAAVWHKEKNPVGRGFDGDTRRPLIVSKAAPETPVWLAPTPITHPVRLSRAGVSQKGDGYGWAKGTQQNIFNESHSSLWADSLHAGDGIELVGFAKKKIQGRIPPYRIAITSSNKGELVLEPSRIHTLVLLPEAGLGAAIWRVAIDLDDDDMMGLNVCMVVAGLEDMHEKPSDKTRWMLVALDRYDDPESVLDDRPLLPKTLVATMPPPDYGWDDTEADANAERAEVIQDWFNKESGMGDNPFENKYEDQVKAIEKDWSKPLEDANKVVKPDADTGRPKSYSALADEATKIIAKGQAKLDKANLGKLRELGEDEFRAVKRGEKALEAEAAIRLSGPFKSPKERQMARAIPMESGLDADDVEKTLTNIAKGILLAPAEFSFWPGFEDPKEAERFGEHVANRLAKEDGLKKYVDISGAFIASAHLSGVFFDGLLAGRTQWQGVEFTQAKFLENNFVGSKFENCIFRDCEFRKINLSKAKFLDCQFDNCILEDFNSVDLAFEKVTFKNCELRKITFTECVGLPSVAGAGDSIGFYNCILEDIQYIDSQFIEIEFIDVKMANVTFMECFMWLTKFERVIMYKVWGLGKGMGKSSFVEVTATNCGFLSHFRFDGSSFSRTKFIDTGLSNAIFKIVKIEPGCIFSNCDLSGAIIIDSIVSRVSFYACTMTTSIWIEVDAFGSWFYGSIMNASRFDETELAQAVFTDADISGIDFDPKKTIGTDFSGSIKSDDANLG